MHHFDEALEVVEETGDLVINLGLYLGVAIRRANLSFEFFQKARFPQSAEHRPPLPIVPIFAQDITSSPAQGRARGGQGLPRFWTLFESDGRSVGSNSFHQQGKGGRLLRAVPQSQKLAQ
ncbi:hypothetical protein [Muricoccus pecuniae]|uniref:Uncharacterized protein n=1 Tax=Muricoccus pecuniae TaxID=693023 RepID=A0A840YLV1_9PROT|nr:hypothetical protein [Roseomonas pecuniae]MBB5695414.1 hypothetical protein [Roseomonas pecuniae]